MFSPTIRKRPYPACCTRSVGVLPSVAAVIERAMLRHVARMLEGGRGQ